MSSFLSFASKVFLMVVACSISPVAAEVEVLNYLEKHVAFVDEERDDQWRATKIKPFDYENDPDYYQVHASDDYTSFIIWENGAGKFKYGEFELFPTKFVTICGDNKDNECTWNIEERGLCLYDHLSERTEIERNWKEGDSTDIRNLCNELKLKYEDVISMLSSKPT